MSYCIVFADPIAEQEIEWVQSLLHPNSQFIVLSPESNEQDELLEIVADCDFVIARQNPINEAVIAAAPKLKLIQKYGSYWNGIDIEAARDHGVRVATMPLLGVIAVAELVMTLMLASSKCLLAADRGVRSGEYEAFDLTPQKTSERSFAFQWLQLWNVTELWGETLGLIGLGEIGLEVSRRAHAFGLSMLYWKRERLLAEQEQQLGVSWAGDLETLLRRSRFVSISVPHTSETAGLIGKKELELMRDDAFLINTARGAIIDERALYQALKAGAIAGAGLDVFTFEPLPTDSPLIHLENVILTPHIGGGSGRGNRERQMRDVLSNILLVAGGEQPQHAVF